MTHVFDQLKISGYRGFEVINLSGLGQVNIIVGNNNSGKTSLLEAISILCNPLDPLQWIGVSQRRLYLGKGSIALRPDIEAMKWIFPQRIGSVMSEAGSGEIHIEARGTTPVCEMSAKLEELLGLELEKRNRENINDEITTSEGESETGSVLAGIELEISAKLVWDADSLFAGEFEQKKETFEFWEKERFIQRKRNPPLVKNATIFPSYSSSEPIVERLSRIILQEEDGKHEILELLRSFDRNILDIQILSTSNSRAALYIEHQEIGFAPLYVFGDGFKRTLIIALTILTISNGVLLIDEIETSIHVSALRHIFSWLIETCRQRNIQLFVTTHSLEAIDAMLQPELVTDDIVAFRLNPKGEAPQRFSGSLLHRLRSERGLDVR